jgi:putative CGCGG family rSAM target protein
MEPSHDDVDPITEEIHHNSWSANLEQPAHADDRALVLEQARVAVEHTASGNHVNLVTHGNHGHPETFLFEMLTDTFGESVDYEYVDQCGCGGHVTRVHVT